MKKVLYHANCNDGSAAALAVWLKCGDNEVDYIPVQYGHEANLSDLAGNDVIIVDFSYKADAMREIAAVAKTVLVLDHHKTAHQELAEVSAGNMVIVLEHDKSGAVMAWEYFHPDKVMPRLFYFVQDRDLWRGELDGTKDIHMALQLHSDFRNWARFVDSQTASKELEMLRITGAGINAFMLMKMEDVIKTAPRAWALTGDIVPLYNLPGFMLSDTLHLALGRYPGSPYAVGYFDLHDKRIYSLRSMRGSGVDVSLIARGFGGGGHKHASGFSVDLPREPEAILQEHLLKRIEAEA